MKEEKKWIIYSQAFGLFQLTIGIIDAWLDYDRWTFHWLITGFVFILIGFIFLIKNEVRND